MYPGGHNGEQLGDMCLAVSEDVHNSLMSKNNSNNDAVADCTNNNNKEDGGTFPGSILFPSTEGLHDAQ